MGAALRVTNTLVSLMLVMMYGPLLGNANFLNGPVLSRGEYSDSVPNVKLRFLGLLVVGGFLAGLGFGDVLLSKLPDAAHLVSHLFHVRAQEGLVTLLRR